MKLQEKEAKQVRALFAALKNAEHAVQVVLQHIAAREDINLATHIFNPDTCEFVEPKAVEQPKVD